MISHSILLRVGKILDNAFALYIHQHVIDCYDFLVRYYNPGDRLFFFGLSSPHYLDGRRHLADSALLQDSLVVHTLLESLRRCYTKYSLSYSIFYQSPY
jgi:hypothetical protein